MDRGAERSGTCDGDEEEYSFREILEKAQWETYGRNKRKYVKALVKVRLFKEEKESSKYTIKRCTMKAGKYCTVSL